MKKGFTLIELVMVLSIISIMLTMALPSYFSMRQEGMLTKAQKEVTLLQAAVEGYWQENAQLPKDLTIDIFKTKNKVLTRQAYDPWKTEGDSYGYKTGKTVAGEDYYIIYSKGLADKIDYAVSGNMIVKEKDTVLVSNLPIISDQ